MPDFITVVKEWVRMCTVCTKEGQKDGLGCVKHCKLASNDVCGYINRATHADIIKAEQTIMQWAKEHTEPVYPTWDEWLTENLGLSEHFSIEELEMALKQPIRADIAEKLELSPKEVES